MTRNYVTSRIKGKNLIVWTGGSTGVSVADFVQAKHIRFFNKIDRLSEDGFNKLIKAIDKITEEEQGKL